jgi:hypothetical protein
MIDFSKLKDNLVSFGFSKSCYPIYLVDKDTNLCINVNIPEEYGEFPDISNPSFSMFRITNEDVILMFYQGITMDLNIKHINGHKPFIGNTLEQYCSYCKTAIYQNKDDIECGKPLKDLSYYYCIDCQHCMCPLCHSETDYEIAMKHKVNISKFEKRLPKVLHCIHNHNVVYIPATSIMSSCVCDNCNKSITLFNNNRSSESLQLYSYNKNIIRWYNNRENNNDICIKCSHTVSGKELIKKYDLELVEYKPVCEYLDFGSLLDWVPIYVSNSMDFILYNLNINSPNYKRLAYCHNNEGYYITYMDSSFKLDTDIDCIKMIARLNRCIDYSSTINAFKISMKNNFDSSMQYNHSFTTSNSNYINMITNELEESDNILEDILPM